MAQMTILTGPERRRRWSDEQRERILTEAFRSGARVHDSQEAEALLEAMPEGATLLGDKGYDSNAIREAAAAKNAWANIPSRSNRKQRFAFSGWLYRQRNLVERFFNRIKHFRGIATRYDKCPENYLAAVKLICARIWCAA